MKITSVKAIVALAVTLLLAGCDSSSSVPGFVAPPFPPPPTPLAWDQGNWDEFLWQ